MRVRLSICKLSLFFHDRGRQSRHKQSRIAREASRFVSISSTAQFGALYAARLPRADLELEEAFCCSSSLIISFGFTFWLNASTFFTVAFSSFRFWLKSCATFVCFISRARSTIPTLSIRLSATGPIYKVWSKSSNGPFLQRRSTSAMWRLRDRSRIAYSGRITGKPEVIVEIRGLDKLAPSVHLLEPMNGGMLTQQFTGPRCCLRSRSLNTIKSS